MGTSFRQLGSDTMCNPRSNKKTEDKNRRNADNEEHKRKIT